MNNKIENAKRTLWHYFSLIAQKSGLQLGGDCRTEIEGIVENIVEGIKK